MKTSAWTSILREKITGIAISRHKTEDAARATAAKKSTGQKPIEVIQYSEQYWKEMKR